MQKLLHYYNSCLKQKTLSKKVNHLCYVAQIKLCKHHLCYGHLVVHFVGKIYLTIASIASFSNIIIMCHSMSCLMIFYCDCIIQIYICSLMDCFKMRSSSPYFNFSIWVMLRIYTISNICWISGRLWNLMWICKSDSC